MREALALYDSALSGELDGLAAPVVRFDDGALAPFPIARFRSAADRLELRLLADVTGPVLDVGCGPGRHLHALGARGIPALGIDISPAAVALARSGGASAIVSDVFGPVPAPGSWQTTLLLDGNIGIGGNPARLLRRLGTLLTPTGLALIELDPPGSATPASRARIELDGRRSGWFAWARVAADELAPLAARAGMSTDREWTCGERWFAELRPSAD